MQENNIVQLKNISKSVYFGKEKIDLLQNVSLSIKQGEFVAIVGPSGSGKSTLLNIIGCLDKATNGEYTLLGNNISNLNEDELAEIRSKKLGFIFQSFHLISDLNALENIMVPQIYSIDYDEAKGLELIKSVELSDRITHKPNELSGGQKQRVAIARALINNPDIILADEPTGNLDSKTGEQIFELLIKLHKAGKTIIMVTHDANIAKKAERIITVKDGKIV